MNLGGVCEFILSQELFAIFREGFRSKNNVSTISGSVNFRQMHQSVFSGFVFALGCVQIFHFEVPNSTDNYMRFVVLQC